MTINFTRSSWDELWDYTQSQAVPAKIDRYDNQRMMMVSVEIEPELLEPLFGEDKRLNISDRVAKDYV